MTSILAFFESIPLAWLLGLSAFFTILGDYFGKTWSINQQPLVFILAFILYASGGLFFIPTLQKESLIVSSIIFVLLTSLGNFAVGLLIFHEKIDFIQCIGLAFGFVAVLIFALRH